MPRLNSSFSLLYPYTQPSPAVKIKSVADPHSDAFDASANYEYNYYVENELTVPGNLLTDDPRGLPRSVTITAGANDEYTAVQIDDRYDSKNERDFTSKTLGDDDCLLVAKLIVEIQKQIGKSTQASVNFEEYMGGDFLGVTDTGSNLATTLQANLNLQTEGTGPSHTIRYDTLSESSILKASSTPEFVDSFGDRFEAANFRIIPNEAGDFEFEGPFSGQSGKSYNVAKPAIPSVLLQALTSNPFSPDQNELTRSAGNTNQDSFTETVSNLKGFLTSGGDVPLPASTKLLTSTDDIVGASEEAKIAFKALVEVAGFQFALSPGDDSPPILTRTTYCPIGFTVRRVDLGTTGGLIGTDGEVIPDGSGATEPAYLVGQSRSIPIKGRAGEFVDGGVIAGHRYVYEIRRVHAMIRTYLPDVAVANLENLTTGDFASLETKTEVVLLAGKPRSVQTTTMPIPQAGKDLSIVPQFFIVDNPESPTANKDLRVTWNNPEVVLGGVPIRSFMLFRRKSVLEPFTLVAVHKAMKLGDDSRIRIPQTYTLDLGRIPNTYFDEEFDRDTSYIYAVAATDAYGRMTGLSIQFRVKYNPGLYELEVDEVSPEGAPMQFPNLFINTSNGGVSRSNGPTDFTTELSDSIMRTSGADRIRVFPSTGRSSYGFEEGQQNIENVITRVRNSDGSVSEESIPIVKIDTASNENRYVLNIISLNDEKTSNLTLRFT